MLPSATLTTREAHEYVRKRGFFEEVLVGRLGLKPVYIGPGHRTVLFSREAIDTLMRRLELLGGHDSTTGGNPIPDNWHQTTEPASEPDRA